VASKFAVRGMTKQVAVEYGAKNIREFRAPRLHQDAHDGRCH
jgi:hypothetical protein